MLGTWVTEEKAGTEVEPLRRLCANDQVMLQAQPPHAKSKTKAGQFVAVSAQRAGEALVRRREIADG